MDGIINVIKPPGMSSHQVVSFIRRVLRTKKVGHTGTLDPGAAGVLPICVGKGTRVVPFLIEKDKSYVVELTLGITTSTQDASGETLDVNTGFSISPKLLGEVVASFLGEIKQIPPMTSAIRVAGKRLYELAREGKTVERQARTVTIHSIHINKVWPEEEQQLHFGSRVLLEVSCSKGTYIRTLCHDIGEKLGVGAHMSFLSRNRSGHFSLQDGYTLEEIEEKAQIGDYDFLWPIERALPEWPKIIVSPIVEERIGHGNYVKATDLIDVPQTLMVGDQVLLFNLEGDLLALAKIRQHDGLICQPTRVLRGE